MGGHGGAPGMKCGESKTPGKGVLNPFATHDYLQRLLARSLSARDWMPALRSIERLHDHSWRGSSRAEKPGGGGGAPLLAELFPVKGMSDISAVPSNGLGISHFHSHTPPRKPARAQC
ncbi:hypothetical protein AB1N83_006346 [Pleurotus pulmonarius]